MGGQHNHPPDGSKITATKIVNKMQERAATETSTNNHIYRNKLPSVNLLEVGVWCDVAQKLPTPQAVKRSLQRIRQRTFPTLPKSIKNKSSTSCKPLQKWRRIYTY